MPACKKGDGGTAAEDGGDGGEVLLEIVSQALLGTAADVVENGFMGDLLEDFEEGRVLDWPGPGVFGGNVDGVRGQLDASVFLEPSLVESGFVFIGHDPEAIPQIGLGFRGKKELL